VAIVIPSLVAVTAMSPGCALAAGAPPTPAPPDAAQASDGTAALAINANTALSFARRLTIRPSYPFTLAYGVS
jgi:hypothetical protein